MDFPDFLNRVEEWMRMKEDQMAGLTKAFLKMDTVRQLIFNLFMIAVLPAMGEELLFRGVLQKLLIDSSRNHHAGIWIAAIIFSALHFQFYGFLPRMFLGVLFGYLFYWSGNIWLPIIAHFINNSTVVVVSYLFQHKFINFDIDKASKVSIEAYVACFAISVLLVVTFYRNTRSSTTSNYGNELD
ncbi:CAAX amino terminal protease self- immunity [compost metagenome]